MKQGTIEEYHILVNALTRVFGIKMVRHDGKRILVRGIAGACDGTNHKAVLNFIFDGDADNEGLSDVEIVYGD